MSTLPATTDVVIVGAGPTGLTLACILAAEGVSFVLVERLAEGLNTSRAAVVHARSPSGYAPKAILCPGSPFETAITCWPRYTSTGCPPATPIR